MSKVSTNVIWGRVGAGKNVGLQFLLVILLERVITIVACYTRWEEGRRNDTKCYKRGGRGGGEGGQKC